MAEPSFTVQDVLDRVRLLKADATYAPANAYLWITDALIELYTQAPKSRIDSTGAIREFVKITSVGDTLPCSAQYVPLIVDYVVARALFEDSDSMDHRARAGEHFKLFFDRAHLIEYGVPNKQTPAPVVGAVR